MSILPLFVFGTEDPERKPYIQFSFWNMFLLDLLSIYIVALKRPFIFGEYPIFEKIILMIVMVCDLGYDGMVFIILGYNAVFSAF